MTKAIKYGGLVLAGVGIVDLLFGNTTQSVLPASITNMLSQQVDAVLIVGGGLAFFYF